MILKRSQPVNKTTLNLKFSSTNPPKEINPNNGLCKPFSMKELP